MLRWFKAENLRCVQQAGLEDLRTLNVLAGPNGSGKTSILEGIHLLGHGRSFRTNRLGEVQRRDSGRLQVVGEVTESGGSSGSVVIGIERGPGTHRMRMGGETVSRTSVLANRFPQLVIRPESHDLLTGGSEGRRRLLDWVLFHVEPEFAAGLARYQRALKQRNAGLRSQLPWPSLSAFDPELVDAASLVDGLRKRFFESHAVAIHTRILELVGFPLEVRFESGWDRAEPFADALRSARAVDYKRGFTSVGPHRADLVLSTHTRRARNVLSRGESKLAVLGLLLSLAEIVRMVKGRAPVLLVDDLASELDGEARRRFFDAVETIACQTFVSAVEETLIPAERLAEAAVFHVKQGTLARVV